MNSEKPRIARRGYRVVRVRKIVQGEMVLRCRMVID